MFNHVKYLIEKDKSQDKCTDGRRAESGVEFWTREMLGF